MSPRLAGIAVGLLVLGLGACSGTRVRHESNQQIIETLESPNAWSKDRVHAAWEIGRRRLPGGEDVLMRHIHDPDPEVQVKAIHSLAVYYRSEKAAPEIAREIFSPNGRVADKAISALVELNYRPAVPDLRRLAETARDRHIAKEARDAAATLGG